MKQKFDIVDLGMDGVGIAKEDNKVVFIQYGITGEKVEAEIEKSNKNFSQAKLTNIIQPSKDRAEPLCKYYYDCGGCNLQHINYDYTLQYKTQFVKTTIKKIMGLEYPVNQTIPSDNPYYYRNKIVFNISYQEGKTIVGTYCEKSHKTVEIEDCILSSQSKDLLKAIREFISQTNTIGYNQATHKGILRSVMLRHIDGKTIIVVVATKQFAQTSKLVEILKQYFSNFGLFVNINNYNNSQILSNHYIHIYGLKHIESKFVVDDQKSIKYNVSPNSFMQVNNYIRDLIYKKVCELVEDTDCVVDAYSGAGLLSSILATKCKQVYGLEIVQSATKDAEMLKKQNNITNLKNINVDCSVGLPNIFEELHDARICLVLDPPRKGVDQPVADCIANKLPQKIIYISCNPATLARDLKIINQNSNYDINYIQPYDMFPQTGKVETIVCLKLK